MKKIIFPLLGLVLLCQNVKAQEKEANHEHHGHSNKNTHLFSSAPIGIMEDHMHHKNSLMFSYRFMWMSMNGNLSGTEDIKNSDVFLKYVVSPQSMNMGMHMLGAMYAFSDGFTLMLMGNYISNRMDLKTKMGVDFTTKSAGFGDFKVSGLIRIIDKGKNSALAIVGISIPTGNINQKDDTPMMTNAQLAYPMQLGSGTWDPFIGATYQRNARIIPWGIQTKYQFRIDENSEYYTLGNVFLTTVWGAIKSSEKLNFSLRINYINSNSINGADPDLNPIVMPLFNTTNSGRSQVDLLGGINIYLTEGIFKGLNIGIETGYPVYQNVSGIQMKQNISATIGIQYVFGGQHK